jgi:hypothetical protein
MEPTEYAKSMILSSDTLYYVYNFCRGAAIYIERISYNQYYL